MAGDQLVLGPQGGFVISGSGTDTVTIAGTGTAAQYAAMLELITFSNSGDRPSVSVQTDVIRRDTQDAAEATKRAGVARIAVRRSAPRTGFVRKSSIPAAKHSSRSLVEAFRKRDQFG